ncbi:SDR family oxidoreductase [Pelagicoccus albus]|uniref:SDR family oxidoreductase n=1 Tax=Pelagicoccus albus TaxID=415222 RepID=A0A7X1EA04_9BACT|nr:SDR family oxidoreductase [Pelagicoccus albus]MBC2607896.1 SDR family oxidoreductase [Pelagicoccus albus]
MKRIFITGSNRGLGLGFVRLFLERGDQVFAACRRPAKAEALQELKAKFGGLLTLIECDVTDEASILAAAAEVSKETDALDWVINNAGQGGLETLADVSFKRGLELYAANCIGPIVVARTFRELLKAGSNPLLIQISSRLGSIGERESEDGRWVDGYVYPSTKAALNMMSRQLWKDFTPLGITVVIQSPGWVRTDMGGDAAPLDIETATTSMLKVWEGLGPEDGGRYLSETGDDLPFG